MLTNFNTREALTDLPTAKKAHDENLNVKTDRFVNEI